MGKLITVFWRDIPAQVMAKERRQTEKVQLSKRFEEAIDMAAMRAGLVGTDAYLEEWKRSSENCGDDLKAEAESAAARIEAEYDKDRLVELVKNSGIDPQNTSQS